MASKIELSLTGRPVINVFREWREKLNPSRHLPIEVKCFRPASQWRQRSQDLEKNIDQTSHQKTHLISSCRDFDWVNSVTCEKQAGVKDFLGQLSRIDSLTFVKFQGPSPGRYSLNSFLQVVSRLVMISKADLPGNPDLVLEIFR
jgi:hypothetical protein